MIIISEYKVDKEKIKGYEKLGIRFVYGYEDYKVKPGEAVGLLTSILYKSTMDLVWRLLKTGHKVTLKYEDDEPYELDTVDDWTRAHPVYQIYLEKRKEYFEDVRAYNIKLKNQYILDTYKDEELDEVFLDTFKSRYNIEFDTESIPEKINAYQQIKFYIEHDMEYDTPAPVIPYDETPFEFMVDTSYVSQTEEPSIEGFGNEIFLDDIVYKTSTI